MRYRIVITHHSMHRSAKCTSCKWETRDKKRFDKNVLRHRKSHEEHGERMILGHTFSEALIIQGGFDRPSLRSFTMDDFRGDTLPTYPEPYNRTYSYTHRIMKNLTECPWGYSRWVPGPDGKLYMFDQNWDSSD